MSKGYFTDKKCQPQICEIEKILGAACENWKILIQHLSVELKLKGEYKFYGVNYGWALRFTKSGRSVIALYPDKDCFMVQIILNDNQVKVAMKEIKEAELSDIIQNTESIHEGKWIYFQQDSSSDLQDLFHLIAIRLKK